MSEEIDKESEDQSKKTKENRRKQKFITEVIRKEKENLLCHPQF